MRTRNRKLLAVLLTMALLVSLFTGLTFSASADYTPTGTMTSLWNSGSPTSASSGTVYSISSATELGYLASYVATSGMNTSGVTFYLTQGFSIDGMTWSAVGTSSQPFNGTFDGCNMTITWTGTATATASRRTVSSYFGIFGYNSSSGVVENLTVAGSLYLKGNTADFVSTTVAYNAGIVDHITNNALLDSSGTSVFSVAGVVGGNARFVLNSHNSAVITAYRKVGGIVGTNAGTSSAHAVINSCSNVGAITATYANKNGVGGIAGFAGDTDGTQYSDIWNCYNRGTITCSNGKWVGGIVGFENNKSHCINCYNTGDLYGVSYLDHISGKTEGSNTNCYGLISAVGPEGYDGAIPLSSGNMQGSTFAGQVSTGADAR